MTGSRADLFINRELSWLAFNERVLEEAQDRTTPLLERVKFAAIVASNLDEFFMVRVAGLQHAAAEADESPDIAGLSPTQQLAEVIPRAHAMMTSLYQVTLDELLPALASQGVSIVAWSEISRPHQLALATFFNEHVLPVLTPLAIDMSRPFPLLSSLSLNLALRLDAPPGAGAPGGEKEAPRVAIVQVPPGLTRLVQITEPGSLNFVLLEEVISAHLSRLFPGQPILESAVIRLARDAEMELDDEGGRTQLELVERELRRRRRSGVIRLEVSANASEELVTLLRAQLDITPDEVYVIPGPLDLRVLMGLTDLPGLDALRDPPRRPVDVLADVQQSDVFSALDERGELLLQHPYEAYDPVMALIAQAADDPDVLAIKQTLYRTSVGSPIIASLQRAAEQNKQVTVLVELTARFDEERNIHWARALEEAGAHVIYGVHGYKTHAKICLIVRRTRDGLKRYVHLGTGNYNERTARMYTDFGLLTTSEAIAEDATAVFNALTGYSDPPRLKKLVMAPTNLRRRFLKLIEREQRRAESGQPAEIVAKMNSLIDTEIIDALYAASGAGVRIRLNVRGICALRPGLRSVSANIEVVSIVDRYLEHSRIYYFLNDGEEEVYLASADWMTRNLDRRVELMFPIERADLKTKVLYTLRAMFRDTVKARWLGADGIYRRRAPAPGEAPFRVQDYLQDEARRLAALARDRVGVALRPEERERPAPGRTRK
ncbi:MAG TPA: polyphosphate kinase 1 [Vicinamibacterales bacterium]|nr:polyphosphate kinase 1 [Vicinamibacterales bacterium]